MYIEELDEEEVGAGLEETASDGIDAVLGDRKGSVVPIEVKRVLIGAGARVLFYPTLLYNVVRNRIQPEFRWWDRIAEFILLGAVPFPGDVPCLRELGVHGVITLNEPYETLVPTALYHAHCIEHLVIPTRDYYFAPSLYNICQAVEFLHKNASCGQTTYVHCKAGRGRSTTVVKHKHMTPEAAYDYVKSIRPRVLLASSQWMAVQEFYHLYVKKGGVYGHIPDLYTKAPVAKICPRGQVSFDDGSVVVVTESDLVGYNPCLESDNVRPEIWADLRVVYRVRVAGQAALARISCLWLQYREQQKIPGEKIGAEENCISGGHVEGISVDIHVY
ncbi:hypothetical protein CRG98_038043 [Punica granatum]|uniref:phosphatidylglycerophosphatase n=1 Tax=Punica granatum TaxID=22663 RepID=A0A2I0IC23_PUNGR|nr:hypothetical protein CRG98_038043 [Punica granatum]